MEIKFDSNNRLQVTAVTAEEASVLMAIAYGTESKPKTKAERSGKGKPHKRAKKVRYSKTCIVEGCEHKTKSMGLHLLMAHGVNKEGEIQTHFNHCSKGRTLVTQPVEKIGDKYSLLSLEGEEKIEGKPQSNFLGGTFNRGAVID